MIEKKSCIYTLFKYLEMLIDIAIYKNYDYVTFMFVGFLLLSLLYAQNVW